MFNRAARVRLATTVAAVVLLLGLPSGAVAQDYRFNVEKNQVDLYVEQDGTVRIEYNITFRNDPSADEIDIFDVGMPNDTYSDVRALIDGNPLSDVGASTWVDPGVEVPLGEYAIQPGASGTVYLEATVRDLLYQDSKDQEYASIEFSPTWFSDDLVYGTTRLEVRFHSPPGVTQDEPRYHTGGGLSEPTDAYFEDDRVVYVWLQPAASSSSQYKFGASYPKVFFPEGTVQKAPAFTLNWDAICSSPFAWFALFGGAWAFIALVGSRAQRRRRMKYLPPSVSVEGTGVKRGLTAVEAAILLEAPLNKVMTMILFGLVKKGIIVVESEKPVKVRAIDPLPKDVKVWYYERRFLAAIKQDGTVAEGALRDLVIDLIGDVNKKLTGFSRKETRAYYRDVAARAWQQVEAADTPQLLGERWGDGLEWTMLEDNWDDRTRRVFHDRPVVLPHWWWFYRPWAASADVPSRPSAPGPMPAGSGRPVTLPTLPGADFANTVVGGIQNVANTVVSGVDKFTGRVSQTTNPEPKTSSSSSRGGGYSCACACACAGCACACAGGGR